jgi:glycosyltransferase involved in cell wall biosynthesis
VKPVVLVVSSVHPPDDPRIRYKLVASLVDHADIRVAVREPGPGSTAGVRYEPLAGGRLRRTVAASWKLLRRDYDVASVHDPELLPAALVAGLLRRRVVFDVHEDIPAQIRTKAYLPAVVRWLAAWLAAGMLRAMERVGEVTLAEPNYAPLFRRRHPVFPNYLPDVPLPPPQDAKAGAVYLGDVTETRGVATAVEAIAISEKNPALTLIGRCAPEVREHLDMLATDGGVVVRYLGYLPLEQALSVVAEHAVALAPLHDLPNYRESFPTKLLDYLALGVPVVASALPGAQRLLGSAPGVVWVEPGDAVELASSIDLILASTEFRTQAAAGASSLRAAYRWPTEEVRGFYLASA